MATSSALFSLVHTTGHLPSQNLISGKRNSFITENYTFCAKRKPQKTRLNAQSLLEVSVSGEPSRAGDDVMIVIGKGAVIADLDPATAKLAIGILGPFLSAFAFLFIARIVMSWYPKLPVGKFPYVIAYAPTEPLLGPTRKLIPPVGGVDVTPVVWFGLVSFVNEILVGPQGLLVLLSQQVQ